MTPADAILWDAVPAEVRTALRIVLREAARARMKVGDGAHMGYVRCSGCAKTRRCWSVLGAPACSVCRAAKSVAQGQAR